MSPRQKTLRQPHETGKFVYNLSIGYQWDIARKPIVPLAMDLVETRPSKVDALSENGDGNHRK